MSEARLASRRPAVPATICALAGAAAAAVAADVAFDPAHRHVPLCPLHATTGLWCPLCGGLRAVADLAHARLSAALQDNLLVMGMVPAAVLWWFLVARTTPSNAHSARPQLRRGAVVIAAMCAVLFTVLRNLPAFGGLHPH